ncbi:MAG: T9SS type A sorting domain-containing protein [bacterium]|nr:T9SS type A sorting domain-containing protein [bacterium]
MVQRITKSLGLAALLGLSPLIESQTMNWAPAGPVNTAGRARNMIVDNRDASGNTLFVGSTSSGVFTTTSRGAFWGPLDDQGTIRNISYMAQAPDGTIYAGTGEGFLRTGQKTKAQPGTGLYKLSNSNALTLVVSSAIVGTVINRVAVSPIQSNNIAITTNKGVWISTDGGANFNLASGIIVPTSTVSCGEDVKFDSNGILYCSIGSEIGAATSTSTASKIYKSSDPTLSLFSEITPTASILSDLNYGRIEIGISASNPNIIYASCANKNPDGSAAAAASLKAFYVSYNAGLTWGLIKMGSPQLDPLSNGGTLASGDYAHTLLVDPTNPDQVFFGSYSFYIFTRTRGVAGDSDSSPIGTWTKLGNPYAFNSQIYLHENIHDIKLIGSNPTMVYLVTDAGIYRSLDMTTVSQNLPPSFQPFYKGLVTGQFNSVSIERTPIGANSTSTVSGKKVDPYSGFIGGTGGNGMAYYSGTYNLVTKEVNYLFGDVYNSEYSKILPDAAFASVGDGRIYRSSNVKTSNPVVLNTNKYSGALSKVAPNPETFFNASGGKVNTGTPFKLWEYYGQNPSNPDSMYFYNDTLRFQATFETVSDLTTKTNFTFTAIRPSPYAIIDSIMVRTGTVTVPVTNYANSPAFNTGQDISLKPTNSVVTPTVVTYVIGTGASSTTITHTLVIYSGTNIASTGPVNTATASAPSVTLNTTNYGDVISVTFTAPPFATKTATSSNVNNATYYRVFATVYYKYKAGDVVNVVDNNISTLTNSYTATLPKAMNWRYPAPSYTIAATTNTAIQSPTYILTPGNISSPNPSFVVTPKNPSGVSSFTISTFGTYSLSAIPVTYSLVAITSTAITNPTYVLTPGNVTQTVAAFIVTPTVATVYTITATGSGTAAPESTTVNVASLYSISNSTATQGSPLFIVSPTVTTSYTLTGISSNTLIGANTSTTAGATAAKSTYTFGAAGGVQIAPNNKPMKMANRVSARLAMILNNGSNTGNQEAIVVCKSPLALNDPLSLVRVSQTGCQTDDAGGNPSTATIAVTGKPTLLEWSKNGTEIYYATDANKVYRVSHINEIMDLSPSSFSGKFYSDIFKYTDPIGNSTLNPVSPYRTYLVGTFDKPITSLSVSKDDKTVVVTLNYPTATSSGTSGLVMLSKCADIRKTVNPLTDWERKDNSGFSNVITYCSLMEKGDSKKVFVGTDNGIFYTSDITTGVWTKANNGQLPNVQIFDIKQQVMEHWDCFNSGQIYVATNGRGVWTNNQFYEAHYVGIQEYQNSEWAKEESHLSLFPNPTNGNVNVAFQGLDGESATLQIMDISGRHVRTEDLGVIASGDMVYSFETTGMNAGVYIVNVSSTSGVKRVAKLIVAK